MTFDYAFFLFTYLVKLKSLLCLFKSLPFRPPASSVCQEVSQPSPLEQVSFFKIKFNL